MFDRVMKLLLDLSGKADQAYGESTLCNLQVGAESLGKILETMQIVLGIVLRQIHAQQPEQLH